MKTFSALPVAVRVVGLIVPRVMRDRWVEEWQSELWYARGAHDKQRLLSLSGMIVDAMTTRRLALARRTAIPPRARLAASFLSDIRGAVRTLARNPAFAALSIAILSLGIGATTTMFSAVKQILLDPLPFQNPEQLMRVYERRPLQDRERNPASFPDFADWRERNTTFRTMAAYRWTSANFTGNPPEEVLGVEVSASYFDVFRAPPLIGRTFAPTDDMPGANATVILAHGLWQRMFGGRNDVIGAAIQMDGSPRTVIGVMPATFDYPAEAGFWIPLGGDRIAWSRNAHNVDVVGRLADGVTLDRAREDLNTIAHALANEYPEGNEGHYTNVFPLHEELVGDVRAALLVLFGAVGLVLLIVCVNVANLHLARGLGRGHELAIRASLGASRSRIARQLLTESAILAAVAGVLGIAIAALGVSLVSDTITRQVPWVGSIALEPGALVFAMIVTLAAALAFGTFPALQCSRRQSHSALSGRRSIGSVGHQRVRSALVVAEVALATTLLIGSALLAQSFVRLTSVDPGIDAVNVLTMDVSLPTSAYPNAESRVRFFDDLEERLTSAPAVTGVGYTWLLPFSGNEAGRNFTIEGRPLPTRGDSWNARFRIADAGYFAVMRIGLIRGRMFAPSDNSEAPSVALISHRMQQIFWADEDPIGKRFRLAEDEPWITIIGVVTDVRHRTLALPPNPEFYLSRREEPARYGTVVIRAVENPTALSSLAREAVHHIDPSQPVSNVGPMRQWIDASVAQPKLIATTSAAFSAVALLLAALGIYGVISYAVSQRNREIGIRIALGSHAAGVLRMVVRWALVLTGVGLVIGMIVAVMLGRALAGLLYGVAPTDVPTYATAAVVLLVIAAVATIVPAVRATRVQPIDALRIE